MADNVVANAGSGGATFATDQRASDSVHFPLTKLVWGALDTFTLVDTGAGAIPIADGGNSITVDGTVGATQSGTWNITNVSGTVSLPTGAATAAKQPALGTAGTASSDVITVQGIASMTPLLATLSGTNNIATVTTVSTVSAVTAISNALPAGTNNIGGVTPQPLSTGGLSYKSFVSAASNNKASVGAACRVYFISIQNIGSVPVYLKMFNAATGSVTAGTTAADYQFMCPANSTAANGAGVVFNLDPGIAMATDLTYMLTAGIATTDNTSTSANIAIVTIGYK